MDPSIPLPLEADPSQAIEKEAEAPHLDRDHLNKPDPDPTRRKNLAIAAAIRPAATKKPE